MVKKHLKRQMAPTTWRIDRKGTKFIIRPRPGHSRDMSLPLSLLFKEYLKVCKTTKEVKNILQDKEVLVDGKRRKSHRYNVGFMSALSIPVAKEHYRISLDGVGKLNVIKISEKESKLKLVKITGKTCLSDKNTQLNFSDGSNTIVSVKDDKYKTGDSLLIEIPNLKITKTLEFGKGTTVLLTGGKHIGQTGQIEEIDTSGITVKTKDNKFTTKKDYVFVVGKDKSEITI